VQSKSRNRKPWTFEENKILKKMGGFYSKKEISETLGRSQSSVKNQALKLNIKLRINGERHHSAKYSNDTVEVARRMRECGMTVKNISERLQVDFSTVQK
jgi:DNA-binding NarL/FixJ family response regulator